jgi:hypothetical protein
MKYWPLLLFLLAGAANAYTVVCDGHTDQAPGLNAELAKCDGTMIYSGPFFGDCKFNETVNLNHPWCNRFTFDATTWDFSAITSGSAIVQATGAAAGSYNSGFDNVGLYLKGPGAGTATTGLVLNDNHQVWRGLNIYGFGTGLSIGNYTFTVEILDAALHDNGTGVLCNGGLTDSGEGITFVGGSIFNNGTNFYNGQCELNLDHTALDYPSIIQGITDSSAQTYISGSNIESSAVSDNVLFKVAPTYGCSAFTNLNIDHSRIVVNNNAVPNLVEVDNPNNCGGAGPWVDISHSQLSGIGATISGNPTQNQVSLHCDTNLGGGGTMNNVGTCN